VLALLSGSVVLADDGIDSSIISDRPNRFGRDGIAGALSGIGAANIYSRLRSYMTAIGVP
jgi:hypothetical protein